MQTFLITPSYEQTALLLDRQRLGKQRAEGLQLLNLMFAKMGLYPKQLRAWANHPALFLWANSSGNFGPALLRYIDVMREEWRRRGYVDNMDATLEMHRKILQVYAQRFVSTFPVFPADLYDSHRAKLLQKDYRFYYPTFRKAGIPIPSSWHTCEYAWTPGTL